MDNKPTILEVIGQRVELRRAGKEFVGRCPFHADKTPSFSVSEEKGLFHCFACAAGGDVFDFIMRADGLTFPEARKALGIESENKPRPTLTPSRKRAAALAVEWAREQHAKFNTMIAVALEQRDLADELGDFELAEVFDRELILLRGFYDSLKYPRGTAKMLEARASIENITAGAEVSL